MGWKLPPLNAIRAFEAAGRCRSFTAAAADLGVTTGAVSRQVKILEDHLGAALFERGNREVRLTTEGQTYFALVFDTLRRLDGASSAFLQRDESEPLRIMCCASFATRWLLHRLPRFYVSHPEARLAISTLGSPRDYLRELDGEDVVIRCGDGSWPSDLETYQLFASELVAVCRPGMLSAQPGGLEALRRQTLLFSQFRPHAWMQWFAAQGHALRDVPNSNRFESGGLTYLAATQGLGVALGERRFVKDDLASGALMIAHPFVYAASEAFHFVCRRRTRRLPYLDEFRRWLVREVELDRIAPVPALPFGSAAASERAGGRYHAGHGPKRSSVRR